MSSRCRSARQCQDASDASASTQKLVCFVKHTAPVQRPRSLRNSLCCGLQVSHTLDGQPKSLTGIAEACLGKPLDKSMQMSRCGLARILQPGSSFLCHIVLLVESFGGICEELSGKQSAKNK